MSKPKVELFTFFYKKAPIIVDAPYVPVMAGNALSNAADTMAGDDTGENISDRNLYYSELTGIYWTWKNTNQDIVGSVHYRRFFTDKEAPFSARLKRFLYHFSGLYRQRFGLIYTRNVSLFSHAILTYNEVVELMNSYDVILPQRRKLRYSVRTQYERYHNKSDLKLMHSIITQKYPSYIHDFQDFLSSKRLHANNMFIMKRADFNRCMAWLFDLLFEFENRIKISDYTGYQQRIMGFMAERLFNVWFLHQDLSIKELPVIYFKHFKFSK